MRGLPPIEPQGDRWTWKDLVDSYIQDAGERVVREYGGLGILALDLALHEDHVGGSLTSWEIAWLFRRLGDSERTRCLTWMSTATGKPLDRALKEGVSADYTQRCEAYRLGFEETYR